jgi:hypothetical protein
MILVPDHAIDEVRLLPVKRFTNPLDGVEYVVRVMPYNTILMNQAPYHTLSPDITRIVFFIMAEQNRWACHKLNNLILSIGGDPHSTKFVVGTIAETNLYGDDPVERSYSPYRGVN